MIKEMERGTEGLWKKEENAVNRKILVVEDNDKNRRLIRDVLLYYGYEVIEAGDGAEGARLAKEHLPALILLDIQMPIMNGFTALNVLRETTETKNIKVIAMTSFAMTGDREKILAAGFDEYISKPIDTRELPRLVERMLAGKGETV
jgi:CheY-like chemotaxis protein